VSGSRLSDNPGLLLPADPPVRARPVARQGGEHRRSCASASDCRSAKDCPDGEVISCSLRPVFPMFSGAPSASLGACSDPALQVKRGARAREAGAADLLPLEVRAAGSPMKVLVESTSGSAGRIANRHPHSAELDPPGRLRTAPAGAAYEAGFLRTRA